MTSPHFHGTRLAFSVSKALAKIGETLSTIRREDGLTWADMGDALGKSDDRARDYANDMSEMPVGAFLLGCRRWNGRFANPVFALMRMHLEDQSAIQTSDTDKLVRVTKVAHLMTVAVLDEVTPGVVDDGELSSIAIDDLIAAEEALKALRIRRQQISGVRLEAVA